MYSAHKAVKDSASMESDRDKCKPKGIMQELYAGRSIWPLDGEMRVLFNHNLNPQAKMVHCSNEPWA